MMYQGLLGAFPFTVSEFEVCTFRDLKVSREQVYAEHKTLAGLPRLQHETAVAFCVRMKESSRHDA